MFSGKKVLLIVTGGIAAYKMPQLVRLLIKAGAEVKVVMTANATAFVTAKTLATVSQNPVYGDDYLTENQTELSHLDLPLWADLVIVAPVTANTIAKIAMGMADNLATTAVLASDKPVYLFPAMNDVMYRQHATQRNLYQLKESGFQVFAPEVGPLAEGYEAKGRLPEPETIVKLVGEAYYRFSHPQVLAGKQVIVTAGGTQEAIDPVRYISNRSSGKMGTELANAASLLGATVTLVTTRPEVQPLPGIDVVSVMTVSQLQEAVESRFATADVVIMAAAPSDFRVAKPATQKIKKVAGQDELTLQLVKNPDILAGLGQHKKRQFVAGFAAETESLQVNAAKKLNAKNVDLIVANQVGQPTSGFNSNNNAGTMFFKDGQVIELPLMTKSQMALKIVQEIGERLQ
ncbi:phosphopantothenoylcysteine decarboxylase phosphopantothenate-cysteine ligase [Lapidilactobacillus concavus DSM 17758]|uniref:Coenzyme A biosynthesis bifunctional protein CoaBC n=1 Tax=Lapidilactobacillus concavus DSM 17758 TaxID=1423735 RepID=A0A0R1WDQ9_9LACO|nr:bifunctional phosphopantothenoylcysteine decarboxylase/phosphopantothenate--cysteine ligase CoaBC [Lapidilactobacillus concavus]KRM13817.1 phosphopantothenoylcysteine decarboxylase phosphopantothenate-cysteine ligase [Lapidilactobacillus concavus DSM 17758]GEL12701.1 DNA/pantothenate metabolism flavoprotein [Lapidilactobacillus concavus]